MLVSQEAWAKCPMPPPWDKVDTEAEFEVLTL